LKRWEAEVRGVVHVRHACKTNGDPKFRLLSATQILSEIEDILFL
jgi:hypothetical protein